LRSVQAWTSVMPCLWQSNEFDSEKGRGRTVAPASLQTRSFLSASHHTRRRLPIHCATLELIRVKSPRLVRPLRQKRDCQIPSVRRHCINAPVRPRLWAPAP
jgi:hypothetical protein